MDEDLEFEVERLIGIAHVHAMNALSQPATYRDSHLAACRDFWKHYAEAFNTNERQCDNFADTLESATRDLMTEIQQNNTVIRQSGNLRLLEDPAPSPQPGNPNALTLDELRLIIRKIIE